MKEMKKKVVPSISKDDLLKRYQMIKPVVTIGEKRYYVRKLELDELLYSEVKNTAEESSEYLSEITDEKKLKVITIVYKSITIEQSIPTYHEVYAQLPLDLLDRIVAFELIYSKMDVNNISDFWDEVQQGYRVAFVQLYSK